MSSSLLLNSFVVVKRYITKVLISERYYKYYQIYQGYTIKRGATWRACGGDILLLRQVFGLEVLVEGEGALGRCLLCRLSDGLVDARLCVGRYTRLEEVCLAL